MKHLLAILFALFATSAFAVGIGNDNPPSGGGVTINTNLNDVSNRISNDVRQNAYNFAAGGVGYGGNALSTATTGSSGATANAGGSTAGVNFAITTPRNTPDVFSGNVYPTTNCAHSTQVGGSGVGFGFTVGTSYLDEECSLRETSRSFAGMGLKEDALHVLCSSKFSVAAPSCKAIAAPAKAE